MTMTPDGRFQWTRWPTERWAEEREMCTPSGGCAAISTFALQAHSDRPSGRRAEMRANAEMRDEASTELAKWY